MNFFSEYGEDRWMAENLTLPESGLYIDVGAGHPVTTSNTAFLREKGWVGVSIDVQKLVNPWPGTFIQAAISDAPFVGFDYNGTCGRIVPKDQFTVLNQLVAAVPLSAVISYFGTTKIDFLSIDLEGHEFNAFNTFDWRAIPPKIIVAEYNTLGIGEDFRLRGQLTNSGLYKVVHQTVANLIYVRI